MEAQQAAKAQEKAGQHPFQRLSTESGPDSGADGQTAKFLKDLNVFIRKNADAFAAPSDVQADLALGVKVIQTPLSIFH